ncbi:MULTISPECIES: formate/nitrite transporter family protein [unclassified Pseudomonas]|uniref:formate/nitrite transporter family protein n=1 Tax=unclassified Pseudomonas TaxID=196821 RepID=UPI002AC9C5DF|nr:MULTISPECIES: formate/nitrite transporter family protein [unclassified Pseudomonas]MEB0043550.1 formate/nitrite transporter family protein [Pseudomonas sp. MH10]MEB0121222.1 formate/nitrite transporter family protein [Pseudomonas sp. CCI1.2]WPX64233.1 formate/nitrite transporter family protein [Pseudomonas sp. MH10]
MPVNSPLQIAEMTVEAGVRKAHLPLLSILVLGFLAGAFIALGFLLDIHVSTMIPAQWASLGNLLGAAVFPIGLILVVLAGGELLTGNMMSLPMAMFAGRIRLSAVVRNWLLVTLANLLGALFVAYFFGHFLGLTEGPYLAKTVAAATAKVSADFGHAFISGIGCNWLVCLAVWLSYSSKDAAGKILGTWFPVMAFVAIGFQHVVANMFLIPAAIFADALSWGQFFENFVAVFLGNAVGGAVFVGLAYYVSYASVSTVQVAPLEYGVSDSASV